MSAFEVLAAVAAVLLSAYAALRSVREPRPPRPARVTAPDPAPAARPEPEPDAEPEPEREREPEPASPSALSALRFSDETRARPIRRVSSAMALLVLTLIAAGGIATAIYRGLIAAWPGG